MIWFNIKKLEEKISRNELSEKDGFNYVLAFFILSALTMSTNTQIESAGIKLLNCILLVLITIWGLNAAYKANSDLDGKDFCKRFFAINWVIGVRMLLVVVILTLIAGITIGIISIINHYNYMTKNPFQDYTMTIFTSMFEVIYYLLVINSIRRIKPITD